MRRSDIRSREDIDHTGSDHHQRQQEACAVAAQGKECWQRRRPFTRLDCLAEIAALQNDQLRARPPNRQKAWPQGTADSDGKQTFPKQRR